MTKAVANIIEQAMALSEAEREELLERLMEAMAEDWDDSALLTDELKAELTRRAKFMDEHPQKLIPMEEAHRRIKAAHRARKKA